MKILLYITFVLVIAELNAIDPNPAPPSEVDFRDVNRTERRDLDNMILRHLTWKYNNYNPNCSNPGNKFMYCYDIRLCRMAKASLRMGGKPNICGWVSSHIPRVCCGLPLVLGENLIRRVEEERARTRECGTQLPFLSTSPTETRFYDIYGEIPQVGIEDKDKYDPPLDFTNYPLYPSGFAVGGYTVIEGQYPWMVAIFKGERFWCGGTLIDRSHILSAAHCFINSEEQPNPAEYTARIGSIHRNETVPFKISKIVAHEDYDFRRHYNDIAMLTTENEILSQYVAHICLPDIHIASRDLTGQTVKLLGWGDLFYGGPSSFILQQVDIPVVSNYQCDIAYRSIGRRSIPLGLTDDFICAGQEEGEKDACQYDSGGPLMYKSQDDFAWTLIGIVSFGYNCAVPGYPGVYTRVAKYMDWITNQARES